MDNNSDMLVQPDFSEAMEFIVVEPGDYPVKVVDAKFAWPKGATAENPVKANGEQARQSAAVPPDPDSPAETEAAASRKVAASADGG